MEISSTRFGTVRIEAEDVLHFPQGLIGFETCCHWILLADSANDAVAWLQCISRPDVALPVVSPRRYVRDYRLQVAAAELETLDPSGRGEIYVLAILGHDQGRWTLNLKAPVIVNLSTRCGRQVVAQDDQPLQLQLPAVSPLLRKTA
ncbi:MAG: flagellar assembly protein FliW [Pirellulaceae bacterium]|nr:flagellar assembly protein FliW [Pirellulaceae bacterium]